MESILGILVQFDQRRRSAAERKKQPGGAQILMFTGVRYERGPVAAAGSALHPTKPKRKRG